MRSHLIESLQLGDITLEYELKKTPRGQTMRLALHPEKGMIVTAPRFVSKAAVEHFIRSKEDWILKTLRRFEKHPIVPTQKYTKKEIEKYKEITRERAAERLAHFNTFYKCTYNKISIRAQKTRWGSCSRNGNLSFNYKIALLPSHITDYIFVHELCHLKQMNHSPKFWALVAQTIPNHIAIRKELRTGNVRL